MKLSVKELLALIRAATTNTIELGQQKKPNVCVMEANLSPFVSLEVPKIGSRRMQSSAFESRLSVFSLRCLPLHLTLTFSWRIPCLLSHSSCQANKRWFAFPWRLMPRPGRETECWEAGGKPVAGGYQKGRIDVCWLGPGGNSGWWNRWREVTCAAIKLGLCAYSTKGFLLHGHHQHSYQYVARRCLSRGALTPVTQQTSLKHTGIYFCQYCNTTCWKRIEGSYNLILHQLEVLSTDCKQRGSL